MMNNLKVISFGILFSISLILVAGSVVKSQNQKITAAPGFDRDVEHTERVTQHFSDLLNTDRIEEAHYRLLMLTRNRKTEVISEIYILDRQVEREPCENGDCITVTEIQDRPGSRTKIVARANAKDLEPRLLEVSRNDTMLQRFTFTDGKIFAAEMKEGEMVETEMDLPEGVYLSNTFSEIVQAIDFGRHTSAEFSTIFPGRDPGLFTVERIDEKTITLPNKKSIDCWVLKFTRTGSDGRQTPGGVRYVDKKSGKVLTFEFPIDTENVFTYQMLFLL